jgi:hypothetical protein
MKELLVFVVISLPLLAQTARIDPGVTPHADTESRRRSGDFGVQLMLTSDARQFEQAWKPKDTSNLRSMSSVRVGSPVAAVLIFHDCSPNAAGVCDVVSEFVVAGPDGKTTPAGRIPVWSRAPLPGGQLQLGQAVMNVRFEKHDPLGDYKVIAIIRDNVSGATLTLTAGLKLEK